jgi:hypothetical protein
MNFLLSLALAATLTLGIAGDAFAYMHRPGSCCSMYCTRAMESS